MNVLRNMFMYNAQKFKAIALNFCVLVPMLFTCQINLIPNPSFEVLNSSPITCNTFSMVANWYPAFASIGYSHNLSINTCTCYTGAPANSAGYQQPKTGIAYSGITLRSLFPSDGYPSFSNGFALLGVQLSSALQKDHIYDFLMYYSLSNCSNLVNNNLSAYFSVNQYSLNTGLFNPLSQSWYDTNINNIVPQVTNDTAQFLSTDTLNWIPFQGCFSANGGEQYVTIGNFRDGLKNKTQPFNTNFVRPCSLPAYNGIFIYIDDVSLYDLGYYSGKAQCKKDTTICLNSNLIIGNNIKDSSVISWQPNVALSCTNCPNPIASPTVTTKYIVTKTLCSFISKDSITVTVYTPSLSANAGPFKNICLNDTVTLGTNDSTSYTTYTWQPANGLSCANCPQPVTMPLISTTYTLNKNECSFNTSDTVSVIVEPCEVVIPDIFTPNNDNVNDEWKIKLPNGFKLTTVAVYNRWGTLVYNIDDEVLNSANSKIKIVRWDGRTTSGLECSNGVYFYLIHYTDKSGNLKKLKGNLTLIR